MKILFIAPRFPHPATKGDQARVLNSLKHLSKKHKVYFVCTAETQPSRESIKYLKTLTADLRVVRLNKLERYINLLLAPLTLLPFQVMFFHSRDAARQVRDILRQEKIDLVFCQMVRSAPYAQRIKGIPRVLDFQDAYSLNMERRFHSEKGLVKWVSFIEWQLLKRYERKLLTEFDATTIVSKRDSLAISKNKKIEIVPIGVEPARISSKRAKNRLIFTGNLRYFPNRDAIVWFTNQIFPLIKSKIPGLTLQIIGATPPKDVLSLGDRESVQVIANVKDIRPFLAEASLSVAPMRSGSGSQFKVIEALSVGTPVVLTRHAKEGLDFLTEKSLTLAGDSAKDFAEQVIRLLKNPTLLTELSKSGHREVKSFYTWETVTNKLENVLLTARKEYKKDLVRELLRWKVMPVAILLIVLLVGGLLRLYQIDSNVYFGGDEGRDVAVTQQMVETNKPILQGPPTSMVTDKGRVYYGPGYYYLIAPAVLITGGHPASGYFVTALLGTLSILLIYLIGKNLFGQRGALISSFLYAVSLYAVGFERWAWSPNMIPFFTLLAIYGLIKLVQGKQWGLLLLVTSFGFGWQLHQTFLFLLLLVGVIWIRFGIRVSLKTSLLAAAIFVLISSPLLINELRYNFPNLKTFMYYLFTQEKPFLSLVNRIVDIWSGTKELVMNALGNLGVISWFILGLGLMAAIWELSWNKRSLSGYLMLLWPVVVVLPILPLYSGEIVFDQRFIMSLLPWPFLLMGLTVEKVRKEVILTELVGVAVVILALTNLNNSGLLSRKFFGQPEAGLANMIKLTDKITERSKGKPINFNYKSDCATYEDGYRYLLKWRGVTFSSSADTSFTIYEKNSANPPQIICDDTIVIMENTVR